MIVEARGKKKLCNLSLSSNLNLKKLLAIIECSERVNTPRQQPVSYESVVVLMDAKRSTARMRERNGKP